MLQVLVQAVGLDGSNSPVSLVPMDGNVSVAPVPPVSACSAAETLFATQFSYVSDVSIPHPFTHCPCRDPVSRVQAGLDGSTEYLLILAQAP